MRHTKKFIAGTAILAIWAMPTVASAAPPGPSFAPVVCERGTKNVRFSSHTKSNVITHKKKVSIPDGATGQKSITTTVETTVTAGVTYNTGATLSADVVIASLEGTTGLELAANLSKTSTSSQTFTMNFNKVGTYVVFDGVEMASGNWVGTKCNSNGTAVVSAGSGKAKSWAIGHEGAINCASSYRAGSMQAKAKTFC
ncbi:hypothetical protein [Actinoplanes sp. NPDC049118]|uniref:hypothetical protein n=1 Tax=Actinoplanes sp. NPDC049118 TaxID=3155769 RepID=UPI0033ECD4DF